MTNFAMNRAPDHWTASSTCFINCFMVKSTRISDEDRALFRDAIGEITPIRKQRVLPEKKRPVARPLQREADDHSVMVELLDSEFDPAELEMGDELLFLRPGIQKQALRKLRRGQFPVEAELDLHGMRVAEARAELAEFLKQCQRRARRCVRIIHGKGLGSKDKKPVIKNKLNNWLQQRDEVLAYCSARQIDGGTGAIYLLLKKSC
ncbi:MAG: Smr/MutS family protein [Gammaproteobacteria bacterium]